MQELGSREQAAGEAPRAQEGRAEPAARPVWLVPESRWGPYLPLVSVRAPDFELPPVRLWVEADGRGDVVGLVAENAAGERAHVSFDHPPVVASELRLAPVSPPRVLH